MSDKKTNWQDSAQKNSLNTFRSTFSSLIKMVSKNFKPELDDVFKKFRKFVNASQHRQHEQDRIANVTQASIDKAVSACSASGEKRQELLSDAKENADRAADILLRLYRRLADDYGRNWRRDLITHQLFAIPEQEVIEAFSLLAVLGQTDIPTSTIHFLMRVPGEYGKTRASLTVSGEAYVFGLLDCVGELDRVIFDSLKNNQTEFLKRIFKKMEELYTELERFREFPNRKDPKIKTKNFANLKHRIDVCGGQVFRCRKLLQDRGIL